MLMLLPLLGELCGVCGRALHPPLTRATSACPREMKRREASTPSTRLQEHEQVRGRALPAGKP